MTDIKVKLEPGQAAVGELTRENIESFANLGTDQTDYTKLLQLLIELLDGFADRNRRCWICITHNQVHYFTMQWTVWEGLAETDQIMWDDYLNDPMWWREQISTRGSFAL